MSVDRARSPRWTLPSCFAMAPPWFPFPLARRLCGCRPHSPGSHASRFALCQRRPSPPLPSLVTSLAPARSDRGAGPRAALCAAAAFAAAERSGSSTARHRTPQATPLSSTIAAYTQGTSPMLFSADPSSSSSSASAAAPAAINCSPGSSCTRDAQPSVTSSSSSSDGLRATAGGTCSPRPPSVAASMPPRSRRGWDRESR